MTLSATQQKRLDQARRGALQPDFPTYAELIDLAIRAEVATARHAEFIARWQAAGSPRDLGHPAADDLHAAHSEAVYLRTRIADTLQHQAFKLEVEREIAKHHPRQGQALVIAHVRVAKLERRPLKLPNALAQALRAVEQAPTSQPRGKPSEPRRRRRRGPDGELQPLPAQAGTGRQRGASVAVASLAEERVPQLALDVH